MRTTLCWTFSGAMSNIFRYKISFLLITLILLGCSKDDDDDPILVDTGPCLVEINGQFQEVELDIPPEYLDGGHAGFVRNYVGYLNYPAEAREDEIEGDCLARYEITRGGRVENIVVIDDPGGGIGNSMVTALDSATRGVSFSPGMLDGSPVRVMKEARAIFKLE